MRQRDNLNPISSNSIFQSTAILLLLAHLGALIGVWFSPRGGSLLLALNAALASAVLLYTVSRARYILAAVDWPYLGLITFELLALAGALWAFMDNRPAMIWSYVAFGLHACASLAAAIFAFTFKITRLF